MTRVAVLGNAGGGKSILARRLAAATELPLHPLDHLLWRPGWQAVPEAEFHTAHRALIAEERWIIDGVGTLESIRERLARCDTVILVDLPLWRHLWWAMKRQAACLVRPRPDGPPGCPMLPVTGRLLRMIWWIHLRLRPELLALAEASRSHARVCHLRRPRDLEEFLAESAA